MAQLVHPQVGHAEMVGGEQEEGPEHNGRGEFKGGPGHTDSGDVRQGERLAQRAFGVAVHVGVQNVVQRAVLDANSRDQGKGQGELEGRCDMEEHVAQDGAGDEQSKGPPPNPFRILESAFRRHGTKERPTPEKGVGPVSLLNVGGISPCP